MMMVHLPLHAFFGVKDADDNIACQEAHDFGSRPIHENCQKQLYGGKLRQTIVRY
jgi:hypothetical protein